MGLSQRARGLGGGGFFLRIWRYLAVEGLRMECKSGERDLRGIERYEDTDKWSDENRASQG